MHKKIPSDKDLLRFIEDNARYAFEKKSLVDAKSIMDFMNFNREQVKKAHIAGSSGKAVCGANSLIIDMIVKALYDKFCAKGDEFADFAKRNLCIVALGGYGRQELCPASDIDISFIYGSEKFHRIKEFKIAVVNEIMDGLWAAKLRLGHSSRTVMETLEDSSKEIFIRTSLLDARLICGSELLYSKLNKSLRSMFRRNKEQHIADLLKLKSTRHQKYDWTVYIQEPNIKNGIGALRDFQTMLWIAMLNYDLADMSTLVRRGYLSLKEYVRLNKVHNFILRVRNQMHYDANRENDLLDLHTQVAIAKELGFKDDEVHSGDENMMTKLFHAFRFIHTTSKMARRRLKIAIPKDLIVSPERYRIVPSHINKLDLDGFMIIDGFIRAKKKTIFEKDPTRLIKVFRYAQRYACGLEDSLIVLIKDNLHLITDEVRKDKTAIKSFLSLINESGSVVKYLYRMHTSEVLGCFIPEFRGLTCLVQHEIYHRYTADVHTLTCIFNLDNIFTSSLSDSVYGIYHKVLTELQDPNLLYIALLLHDIGKSKGTKNHAKNGVPLARSVLERLNFSKEKIDLVLFLVEYHLEFTRVWRSQDIENAQTAENFAKLVKNEELLRYLFILTFCDSMGTSPELWNSYKEFLHEGLYYATLFNLSTDEEQVKAFYEARKNSVYDEILDGKHLSVSKKKLDEYMNALPENYFLYHGKENLLMHLKMINQLEAARKTAGDYKEPIIKWRDDPNRTVSEVSIVFNDKAGLFYKYVMAFACANLNILSCRILTRQDNITLDTFFVTGVEGGFVQNKRAKQMFSEALTSALNGKDLSKQINGHKVYGSSAQKSPKRISPRVSVKIEEEKLLVHLAVVAFDATGLLARTVKCINDFGFNISFARINTDKKRAFDSFEIYPINGIINEETLEALKNALLETLS